MKNCKAMMKDVGPIALINRQFCEAFKKHDSEIPIIKYQTQDWVLDEIEAGNLYVFKDKSEVLGSMCLYMSMKNLSPDESYIESLAVRSDKHRNGYGRKMIHFAKRKSRNEGKRLLTVESFCLYDVKDFYIKCGFELEPELGECGGHKYYRFFMKLP
ncbi:MAG: GNAT family N-acetyltransferase [Nanoarchaeota archaeon]|nr:GNAT family N-acetyltransferase [Nanoarchaeota archaeon]